MSSSVYTVEANPRAARITRCPAAGSAYVGVQTNGARPRATVLSGTSTSIIVSISCDVVSIHSHNSICPEMALKAVGLWNEMRVQFVTFQTTSCQLIRFKRSVILDGIICYWYVTTALIRIWKYQLLVEEANFVRTRYNILLLRRDHLQSIQTMEWRMWGVSMSTNWRWYIYMR